jgi:hypothetical protein
LQTILLFMVPAIVALAPTPAQAGPGTTSFIAFVRELALQAEPDEPFDQAALLGWSKDPPLVLFAERNSAKRITLRLLNSKGKLVKRQTVDFAAADDAPAFEVAALRKWETARELMKANGMVRGRSHSLDPEREAVMHTRYIEADRVYYLTTTAGEEEVYRHGLTDKSALYPYYPPGGAQFALAGTVASHEGQTGVLVLRSLPAVAETLSDRKLVKIWSADASNRIAFGDYIEAGGLLKKALKLREDPKVQFRAALVDAYLMKWGAARDKLAALVQKDAKWADRAVHEPLLREARLRGIDINHDEALTFKASKGYEGTSVWVKVKDANGHNVAIFKPTNGNTYHRGEVFTYQMSKLLGIEKIYPVTTLQTLDKDGCQKFVSALEKVKYKGMKEKNRVRLIKKCRKGSLEGAVKEWVSGFQFFQAIGTSDKLKKHHVFSYLSKRYSQPPKNKTIKARTVTKYYKPDHCKRGTYKGTLDVAQLARDVSDLLIMDVLNANEDRFPGANIDFKTLGKSVESRKCVFDFGPSRLFSLDNGATFKGTYSNGYVDFTKRLKPTRFVRRTYQRLKAIDGFVKGEQSRPIFLGPFGIVEVKDLSRYLALDKGDSHKRRKNPFKLFTTNLRYVLERLDRFADEDRAWFK